MLHPVPLPLRGAGLAFIAAVAALRVAEYRRGRLLAWPVDLADIGGVALLVATLSLQPARSMLFGVLTSVPLATNAWRRDVRSPAYRLPAP